MNTNRTAKVAKITALLQKTVENGCTADEAIAARRLADTLMKKYDISPAECVVEVRRPRPTVNFNDIFREAMRQDQARRAEESRRARNPHGCNCDPLVRNWFRGDDITRRGTHHTTRCPLYTMTEHPTRKESVKTRMSHKHCTHEATPAARAKCRKAQGR